MARHPFKTVDVFTATPFLGNPLAVVFDADDLSTAQMQRIANWTNLSETTFVLRPTQAGADYRVRIFTPGADLPFAGHPTIGTAHALLEAGSLPMGGSAEAFADEIARSDAEIARAWPSASRLPAN